MSINVNEESLKLHKEKQGALEVIGTLSVSNPEDLALAYTPGVAAPCLEIYKNEESAYDYTIKGKTVAVVTNGTSVLGLGNIGAIAGMPVIEGKALLLKRFGNVDAIPICVSSTDPDEIINTIKNISAGFGGIHLEDIKAPECFYIEDELKKILDIPVYHDDQHGTAIAVLAGLYNSLKIVKKGLNDVKIVINGAGASGIATAKLLLAAGMNNIILCDIYGALAEGDSSLNLAQKEIAKITNREKKSGSLKEIIKGADIFIGLSDGNVLSKEMVKDMNKDAIIFALANPTPEISPQDAKEAGARVIATGRSDFPNQINNVLAFPGVFKGILAIRGKEIVDEMKIESAKAIANLIDDSELNEENIVPSVFNEEVCKVVSQAIINVGIKLGMARI